CALCLLLLLCLPLCLLLSCLLSLLLSRRLLSCALCLLRLSHPTVKLDGGPLLHFADVALLLEEPLSACAAQTAQNIAYIATGKWSLWHQLHEIIGMEANTHIQVEQVAEDGGGKQSLTIPSHAVLSGDLLRKVLSVEEADHNYFPLSLVAKEWHSIRAEQTLS
ncbi:hypothetical protein JKP88DRAFT_288807, partial [Tribonema minus]